MRKLILIGALFCKMGFAMPMQEQDMNMSSSDHARCIFAITRRLNINSGLHENSTSRYFQQWKLSVLGMLRYNPDFNQDATTLAKSFDVSWELPLAKKILLELKQKRRELNSNQLFESVIQNHPGFLSFEVWYSGLMHQQLEYFSRVLSEGYGLNYFDLINLTSVYIKLVDHHELWYSYEHNLSGDEWAGELDNNLENKYKKKKENGLIDYELQKKAIAQLEAQIIDARSEVLTGFPWVIRIPKIDANSSEASNKLYGLPFTYLPIGSWEKYIKSIGNVNAKIMGKLFLHLLGLNPESVLRKSSSTRFSAIIHDHLNPKDGPSFVMRAVMSNDVSVAFQRIISDLPDVDQIFCHELFAMLAESRLTKFYSMEEFKMILVELLNQKKYGQVIDDVYSRYHEKNLPLPMQSVSWLIFKLMIDKIKADEDLSEGSRINAN